MDVKAILRAKGNKVVTVEPHVPVATVVHLLKDEGIGAVVVSDNGKRVLGIVSERDVVMGLAQHGDNLLNRRVSEILTREVITCQPSDSVAQLMTDMTHQRVRHLPVVESDDLCGMISIGDIVKYRLAEAEMETDVLRDAYIARSSLPG